MNRKYDSAASRSEAHQNRLNVLAERFSSLENELSLLESKIETELPKLGISVSPLGNRRKGIEVDCQEGLSTSTFAEEEVPVTLEPARRARRKPRPR